MIGAHLLAIPTDVDRCVQREGQALVLQSVVRDYVSRNYSVILMGDFNDYDSNVLDVNQNKPISNVLTILKDAEYSNLTNIAYHVPMDERYSDWWASVSCDSSSLTDYSMIDHILVSSDLEQLVSKVFMYHGYDEIGRAHV